MPITRSRDNAVIDLWNRGGRREKDFKSNCSRSLVAISIGGREVDREGERLDIHIPLAAYRYCRRYRYLTIQSWKCYDCHERTFFLPRVTTPVSSSVPKEHGGEAARREARRVLAYHLCLERLSRLWIPFAFYANSFPFRPGEEEVGRNSFLGSYFPLVSRGKTNELLPFFHFTLLDRIIFFRFVSRCLRYNDTVCEAISQSGFVRKNFAV